MEIDGRIAQANGRLKAAKVGIRIERRGDRLLLRGTLPPKPGTDRATYYQQRLPIGVRANPTGLKAAEAEARKVGALLDCNQFDWTPYLRVKADEAPCAETLIEKFREEFFNKGGKETTWRTEYWKILKRIPGDQPLTINLMESIILATQPNTRTRQRACMVLGLLTKKAGLDYNPSHLAGNYSPSQVKPRDLPDDGAIAEWFYKIKNPGWKWAYGMMATFGLRPHEVFRLEWDEVCDQVPTITVQETTKTGTRRVWAFYPEWFNSWQLYERTLPRINLDRTNDKVGHSATKYFSEFGLPFNLYDLRHAWAIRTLEFGLDLTLAAQQMGHSVQVHTQQYHRWITDRHHQRAYEMLVTHPARPRPPV